MSHTRSRARFVNWSECTTSVSETERTMFARKSHGRKAWLAVNMCNPKLLLTTEAHIVLLVHHSTLFHNPTPDAAVMAKSATTDWDRRSTRVPLVLCHVRRGEDRERETRHTQL